ncbi:hypothetical protein ACM7ZP_02195 [Pseudomonas aeruginosa]
MTKANECTCPSGDGSLRHPCPAHQASVELAGVAAKLTFINGRPAMCGCQVEYSSGGGEYSDVIYVTLCAKHSGSAILDLVATNRIALTPEYEGQWHADLYLDREIPLAKAEGATPAEAVLALMSAERIDPEQESVEQAGGDERAAFRPAQVISYRPGMGEVTIYVAGRVPGYMNIGDTVYVSDRAPVEQPSAALAQPSPAQAEKAEAERPEVVAVMESNGAGGKRLAQRFPIVNVFVGDELMTVAQHERIVKAWIERWKAYIELSAKIAAQGDAANARLHEVATACATAEQERDAALARVSGLRSLLNPILCYVENDIERMRGDRDKSDNKEIYDLAISLAMERLKAAQHAVFTTEPGCDTAVELASHITAQAQHSVPEEFIGRLSEFLAQRGATGKALLRELRTVLAAAPGKEGL